MGVAAIRIFDAFPQFGESRNILIRTFYKERVMLAQLHILSISNMLVYIVRLTMKKFA